MMEEKISFSEASRMSAKEILEANAALDIFIDKLKKASKEK